MSDRLLIRYSVNTFDFAELFTNADILWTALRLVAVFSSKALPRPEEFLNPIGCRSASP
jgi:hypothetical protein